MYQPEELISMLQLQPHPEGGYYASTYRSTLLVDKARLPAGFVNNPVISSAIYYLLKEGEFSAFHRIRSDECWHFYSGGPLEIFEINKDGQIRCTVLGNDLTKGERFQYLVPAGTWFASRPVTGSMYSLVGCTVAPGFDFNDFELASATELIAQYPAEKEIIKKLCRK